MGCFSACFRKIEHRKARKIPKTTPYADQRHERYEALQHTKATKEEKTQNTIKPISDSKALEEFSLQAVACCSVENGDEKERDREGKDGLIVRRVRKSSVENEKEKERGKESKGEEFSTQKIPHCSVENRQGKDIEKEGKEEIRNEIHPQRVAKCSVQNEKEKERGEEMKEKLSTQAIENSSVENGEGKERGKEGKEEAINESQTLLDSGDSSMTSYPPQHRYHNCAITDECCEDLGLEDIRAVDDILEVDIDLGLVQEESSESLFSLSIESKKQVNATENDDKEVNSPITICRLPDREVKTVGSNQNSRDRSQYVGSVLNPVENLSQWKAIKARTTPQLKHEDKENINLEQELNIPFFEEPSFECLNQNSKQTSNHQKPQDQEIGVDTSLSSWLVESERTKTMKNSPSSIGNSSCGRADSWRSYEDRPILGALTVEELRHLSASSSPRRSPSHSPEDMPIIGTVGSYWSHTGQTTDAYLGSSCKRTKGKSSEGKEVKKGNWDSAPFETRLERGIA